MSVLSYNLLNIQCIICNLSRFTIYVYHTVSLTFVRNSIIVNLFCLINELTGKSIRYWCLKLINVVKIDCLLQGRSKYFVYL